MISGNASLQFQGLASSIQSWVCKALHDAIWLGQAFSMQRTLLSSSSPVALAITRLVVMLLELPLANDDKSLEFAKLASRCRSIM